jgi:hypothetical protein
MFYNAIAKLYEMFEMKESPDDDSLISDHNWCY